MTISVSLATVADSISKLTISGVTVKDMDEITSSYLAGPATFSPRPDNFVSDLSVTPSSLGSGGTKQVDIKYTLNYVYYHCALGSVLNFSMYSAMVTNIAAILVALITNDVVSGAVDLTVTGLSNIGPVVDPAGNAFHGCNISVQITELVN